MLTKSPIRNKLITGLALLLVIVVVLSWGGIHGLYAYRSLVRSLSRRVAELPLAGQFSQDVSNLRLSLADSLGTLDDATEPEPLATAGQLAREAFDQQLAAAYRTLTEYRERLTESAASLGIGDNKREWATVHAIDQSLAEIDAIRGDEQWLLDALKLQAMHVELARLQHLSAELPSYLHENIREFTEEAKGQYRSLIVLAWITSGSVALMVGLFVHLHYQWIFRPLRVLIKGSRKVAAGQFDYQIRLDTRDEMSELAQAMNDMTTRFRLIRDDLDRQVQERTKQVVRSEQLASVGFLAAGVAHEINNPLASIAMCAESLESRLHELLPTDHADGPLATQYLRMIQSEAFRCKGITERLLDFSRIGEVQRQATNLGELVQGVIDMIGHLDRYHEKHVAFVTDEPVLAEVNAQEIKQVVLNLVVNGLDALDPGGVVHVRLCRADGQAVLTFTDNGCGMTDEVQKHLFEPFFTRRRGGQGTGLGLSIAYRVVADHNGSIDVYSAGPGAGSRFTVRLPLAAQAKENAYRYQAA